MHLYVVLRIVSKIMANTVKPVLKTVISEQQSAFIENSMLTDNATIAFDRGQTFYSKKKSRNKGDSRSKS